MGLPEAATQGNLFVCAWTLCMAGFIFTSTAWMGGGGGGGHLPNVITSKV